MTRFIDYFAENVEGMLDAGPSSANDLVNLSVGGEQLRRAVASAFSGDVSPGARQALTRYNDFLAAQPTGWPEDLERDLRAAIEELRAFSQTSRLTRDYEDGAQALGNIDYVLATAAASTRAAQGSEAQLRSLSDIARPALEELTPALLDLAQYAEDRRLQFGADPDYPYLYAHSNELADFAPSRLETQATVAEAMHRQALAEKAIADYAAPSLAERVSSALKVLVEKGKELFVLDAGLQPALQPSHASDEGLPELEAVASVGELDILTSPTHLHLLVPDGHELRVVSATTSQGVQQAHEQFGDSGVRVELPQTETELLLELELDGAHLSVPPIPVRPRAS